MKKNYFLIFLLIVLLTSCIGLIMITNQQSHHWAIFGGTFISRNTIDATIPPQNKIIGFFLPTYLIKIHALEPDVPASVPLLRGTFHQGDTLDINKGSLTTPKNNVPSEADARKIAEQILQQYGGLPPDARFTSSYTNYLEKHRSSTGELLERNATDTSVFYRREINGIPIVGSSDKIVVSLGSNGELLYLYKSWRTLENSEKNVALISLAEATEKLQNFEIINRPRTTVPISIDTIILGYYEKSNKEPEIDLEPVWIFTGKTLFNDPITLVAYARKFSNFTVTSESDASQWTIKFLDTSDASPIKWQWEFGDGTISTEQNPVHTYQKSGKYLVSLTAWNDVGSDKKTQILIIHSLPPSFDSSVNHTQLIDPSMTIDENNKGL